jgi:hypothetical protein
MAKKKLNQVDPGVLTLTQLLGHANPTTGKLFRATWADAVALFTAQTPVKTYANEAALLANTDLVIGYIAYVADTETFYLYQGPTPGDIGNYTEFGGGGAVDSVNGQTGVVVLGAGDIGFTPSGGISATDVDGALNELDSEKQTAAQVQAIADAKVADAINDGTTTIAPSQNAVFDALALKLDSITTYRTVTASHTLDATDLAAVNGGDQYEIIANLGTALNLEIPLNATQAFQIGRAIGWLQYGLGQLTITLAVGVTLRSASNANKSFGQYSKGYIEKIGTNEWLLTGDITV